MENKTENKTLKIILGSGFSISLILLIATLVVPYLSFAPSVDQEYLALAGGECVLGGTATADDILKDKTVTCDGTTLTGTYECLGYSDWATQGHQIYDDYQDYEETTGEYTGEEATWINTAGSVWQDQRTGLYWSDKQPSVTNEFIIGTCSGRSIESGECSSCFYDTPGNAISHCCNLSLDADGDGTAETDWRLPTQKELMQAYIDGAANHLPHPDGNFWSATEANLSSGRAWCVALHYGRTSYSNKDTTSYYVRCVRP